MFRLAIGFVIGYILGAKAGHERYAQIRRLTSTVSDHPAVQGVSGFVKAKVTNLLPGHSMNPGGLMLPISSTIRITFGQPVGPDFLVPRSADRGGEIGCG